MSNDVKVEINADAIKKLAEDIEAIESCLKNMADVMKRLAENIEDNAECLRGIVSGPTYEEVRAVLAEKSRVGFRSEVKALLTAHGVKQLSEITDPAIFAEILAEAEQIG